MKTYTIYCTESQTKKALELGASIEIHDTFDSYDIKESNIFYKDKFIELTDGRLIERITAEQMINWLEEQDTYINICWEDCLYYVQIRSVDKGYIGIGDTIYHSRKEATLAAIDVALEYLSNTKLTINKN